MPNQNEQQASDSELKRNQAGQSQEDQPEELDKPSERFRKRRPTGKETRRADHTQPGDNEDWDSDRQQTL